MLEYTDQSEKIKKLKEGELSLVDNLDFFLGRISSKENLNAYNSLFPDARERAVRIESKIKSGNCGKLAGMMIAVKDLLSIKGKPLTCSSRILEGFTSVYTATSIRKLIEEDSVLIGKTNCDEFGMGSSNESSYSGRVLNPINETRVPGGSSGGSAAATAAYLCDASIGTDTGGSIRQPSAFCGLYGLKPSYGLVSRFGLTAYASSFDTIGPIARNTFDAALILEVLAGKDPLDSTSAEIDIPEYSRNLNLKKELTIGIPGEYYSEGLDAEIKSRIFRIIERLRSEGFNIADIRLPHSEYSISTYYILVMAEASSNLARYDGMRYGYRSPDSHDLQETYMDSRSEGFGYEVKRRIMLGTYILSAGYYDAYYRKAQKVRRLIKEDFNKVFEKVDIILTPTTPTAAFALEEKLNDPLKMYLSDIYTTSANLAGIPAMNVPIGTNGEGLPIGMQLIANQFEEEKLLQLSKYMEINKLASTQNIPLA